MALLEIEGLSKSFSGLQAVTSVSFGVPERDIVALIGPNGAGKTTVFNLVAGVFRPDEGEVRLDGHRINGLRPDQICGVGVGRTFQLVKPFNGMTVRDNAMVGALRTGHGVDGARRRADDILDTIGLHDKRHQLASALTLPERKLLEVARALATEPRILLLDEVMAGLRPNETDIMVAFFRRLNEQTGLTILLIEHVMRAVMALSSHIIVMHQGAVICEGAPDDVVRDPAVLDCYLGEEAV